MLSYNNRDIVSDRSISSSNDSIDINIFPPEQLLQIINRTLTVFNTSVKVRADITKYTSFSIHPIIYGSLIAYCLFQLLFPFRYVLYPGNVFGQSKAIDLVGE